MTSYCAFFHGPVVYQLSAHHNDQAIRMKVKFILSMQKAMIRLTGINLTIFLELIWLTCLHNLDFIKHVSHLLHTLQYTIGICDILTL